MWSNFKTAWSMGSAAKATVSYKVGARVRIMGAGDIANYEFTGYVVQAPASGEQDGSYEVELYAPAEGEEDALNPFLVLRRLPGVRAVQMRACADTEGAGLSAVGRPGASMCSVPMAELDQRGFGPNAAGRYARIGGLSSRPDLNGLTCTVLGGPTEEGRYSVELMEEEGSSVLLVRPECLTIRVRRGALTELVAPVNGKPRLLAPGAARSQDNRPKSEPDLPHDDEEMEDAPRLDAPRGQRSSTAVPEAVTSSNGRASARNKASPAAAAALAAAAHAARERKFNELDAYLARCCDDEKDAPGLASLVKNPTACLPASPVRGLPPSDRAGKDSQVPVTTLADAGVPGGNAEASKRVRKRKPPRRHSAPPRGTPSQAVARPLAHDEQTSNDLDADSAIEQAASREQSRPRAGSAEGRRPTRVPAT